MVLPSGRRFMVRGDETLSLSAERVSVTTLAGSSANSLVKYGVYSTAVRGGYYRRPLTRGRTSSCRTPTRRRASASWRSDRRQALGASFITEVIMATNSTPPPAVAALLDALEPDVRELAHQVRGLALAT